MSTLKLISLSHLGSDGIMVNGKDIPSVVSDYSKRFKVQEKDVIVLCVM